MSKAKQKVKKNQEVQLKDNGENKEKQVKTRLVTEGAKEVTVDLRTSGASGDERKARSFTVFEEPAEDTPFRDDDLRRESYRGTVKHYFVTVFPPWNSMAQRGISLYHGYKFLQFGTEDFEKTMMKRTSKVCEMGSKSKTSLEDKTSLVLR